MLLSRMRALFLKHLSILLVSCALFSFTSAWCSPALFAQAIPGTLSTDLKQYVETPAVPGYEDALASKIADELAAFHPRRDAMGDVLVEVGSGAPHRLIVAPMDEPGFVVSHVTDDGYLRVQRLPQSGLPLYFNQLHTAQAMRVRTTAGRLIDGVVAGTSIHLSPGRKNPPDLDDLDNFYIDIGAENQAEAVKAGVELLDPIAEDRELLPVGASQWTARGIGDRFGDAVLVDLLRRLDSKKLPGTVTFAFLAQQWTGARGLSSVVEQVHPDELIFVGRVQPHAAVQQAKPAIEGGLMQAMPGSGPWLLQPASAPTEIDQAKRRDETSLTQDLLSTAEKQHIPLQHEGGPALLPRAYGHAPGLPARTVQLSVPLAWPATAAEVLSEVDLENASSLLQSYLQGGAAPQAQSGDRSQARMISLPPLPGRSTSAPSVESLLRSLVLSYGVSEHEDLPRETVRALLPPWAKPATDAGGNLVLHLGDPSVHPSLMLMAHMDEIGYRVRAVLPDGSLDLENKGGGSAYYFWGHPAILHTAQGTRAGVIALPRNYTSPEFAWPADIRAPATMYVGARSPEEVAALGIRVGDTVTIYKKYRQLLGTRVSARSLDDRVGCAALVRAAWLLGPELRGRNVTLVWSTREELGLFGAVAYAEHAAAEKSVPDFVFAIDTFVSSDSPLESQRFADALLGDGFVIRAIDNSNIVPESQVTRLRSLLAAHAIPVQYGVTGGGNDGAAFLRFGSTDVPLGWPLRYSHSPAELIDTRDLSALANAATLIAKSW
ncbi:MAG: M28 family peptidase [Acidobacteriaceae bacterium]